MIFINCEQGTPEWFASRAGVITASKFADAVSALKNGSPTQASKDYAYKVAIERIFGETTEDTYVTYEMRRGTELEPLARIAYEARTGNLAEEYLQKCRYTEIKREVATFLNSTASLKASGSGLESYFRKRGREPKLTPTTGKRRQESTPLQLVSNGTNTA